MLKLTIACRIIKFFDDIKYKYKTIERENKISVIILDLLGKSTLAFFAFKIKQEKINKIKDDMKNANSGYSIFRTSIMNNAKNIDDIAERILAFIKLLSAILIIFNIAIF